MKSIISKSTALLVTALVLISFTPNFGGEGFEIYLNGKVVLQQFGKDLNNVKNLQLNAGSPNDKLTIKYHHCGRVGKNRIVTIKDGQDKLLKEWRFKDAATPVSDMSCNVKDILDLQTKNNRVYKIFYSSSELPNGRHLVSFVMDNNNVVRK
jgi:hypothetical protein